MTGYSNSKFLITSGAISPKNPVILPLLDSPLTSATLPDFTKESSYFTAFRFANNISHSSWNKGRVV